MLLIRERSRPPAVSASSVVGDGQLVHISRPMATAVSLMRLEKPHSLSYQDTMRQNVPSTTCVPSRSKIELNGSWLKSVETSGFALTPRTPFSGPSAAASHRLVDLFLAGRPRGGEGQVDHADIRHRHPDRGAVELALQLGQHEADSLGGAGRGRDQIDGGGTRPVGILMQRVHGALVAGIGVHRRHVAVLDADRLVQHLRHRSEAIGGAGGVGDDVVLLRELVVVDAIDDGEVGARCTARRPARAWRRRSGAWRRRRGR